MFERWKIATLVAVAALAAGAASTASAATYPPEFDERILAENLTMPTGVAWTPDGRMLIAEKSGQLKVAAPGSTTATQVYDIGDQVNAYWDRGLLGLAVDSSFIANHYIYLLYTAELNPGSPDDSGKMVSRLVRLVLSDNNTVGAPTTILGTYSGGTCPAPSNTLDCLPSEGASHSIGTVRSAPDGTLYVGAGDGSSFSQVDTQALRTYNEQSLSGKILHIKRDGQGADQHPFCASDTNLSHACTKVFAKGFRNPFRFTLRPTGGLVVGDVGWNTREEVDLIPATGGTDAGWPCFEGTIHTPGYEDLNECKPQYAAGTATGPVYDYPHPPNSAVIGGPEYSGSTFPAQYQDKIFFGDYAAGGLKYMNADGSGVTLFGSGWSGTDIQQDPDGNVAYVSFGTPGSSDGSIREVFYSPTNRSPVARFSANPTSGSVPLAVAFDASASTDPDGDALTYRWDFGDGATGTGAKPAHTYTQNGTYTAKVTVDDGRGRTNSTNSATTSVSVGNRAPTAAIVAPTIYRDGQTIQLQGSASDAEDGALPASAYSWDVTLHHQQHTHPIVQPVQTKSPAFRAVTDHDADSFYEITLTVRDSAGVTGTAKWLMRPETVAFRVASFPSGAPISYGGRDYTAPFPGPAAIGFTTSISAASSFVSGGRTYQFSGWSDRGARLHDITVPAAPTTLTALYTEVGGGSSASGSAGVGSSAGNRPPSVSIVASPATTVPRRRVAFTTKASDPDGSVRGLAFDFDGDGVYESTVPPLRGAVPATSTASKAFPSAGKKTVRARATDDDGAVSIAQAKVTVRSFAVKGSVARGQTLARIKSEGLKASSTCPYGCRLRATLTVDARSSRKLGLTSGKPRATNLGAKTVKLSPGRAKSFRVLPSSKLVRRLRNVSGLRLGLVLVATDSAGNRRSQTLAIKLAR